MINGYRLSCQINDFLFNRSQKGLIRLQNVTKIINTIHIESISGFNKHNNLFKSIMENK